MENFRGFGNVLILSTFIISGTYLPSTLIDSWSWAAEGRIPKEAKAIEVPRYIFLMVIFSILN